MTTPFPVRGRSLLARVLSPDPVRDGKERRRLRTNGRLGRWSKYLAILLVTSAFGVLAHEFGHFLAGTALGYRPSIEFQGGGRVLLYDHAGQPVERTAKESMVFSAGGPAMTLLLGSFFTVLFLRRPDSFALFAFGITNATGRLNILLDGFYSDEGSISQELINIAGNNGAFLVPLFVWTVSIILCCFLLGRQSFFRRSYWLIPVFALVTAVLSRLSFALLAVVAG
jgi:hypothetical protein